MQAETITKQGALKVKVDPVMDQVSDREVEYLDSPTRAALRRQFPVQAGDDPMEQAEVTDGQLSLLNLA